MKKFNIFNEIIVVKKLDLLTALNAGKLFGITINGHVVTAPYGSQDVLIYEGQHTPMQNIGIATPKPLLLEDVLGKDLRVVIDDERVLIKAAAAWQSIIKLNVLRASYDDTTGDGISEFSNSKLEELGWHTTEFNVKYRELVEIIEEKCEGTLLCIEQQEPYQFSGMGFIADNEATYNLLFNTIQEKVISLIKEDEDFAKENLTDDELEAAEYFKAL